MDAIKSNTIKKQIDALLRETHYSWVSYAFNENNDHIEVKITNPKLKTLYITLKGDYEEIIQELKYLVF